MLMILACRRTVKKKTKKKTLEMSKEEIIDDRPLNY